MTTRARTKRPGTRTQRVSKPRMESVLPVDDDQLVEEEELDAPATGQIAVHEQTIGQVGIARSVAESMGLVVVAAEAGQDGVAEVIATLRDDEPPGVILVGLPGGAPILDVVRALGPRAPVTIAASNGPAAAAAHAARAAGADLFAVRPHDADRLGPVLAAAARIATERTTLVLAKGTEEILRARLEQYGRADTATGFQQFEFFQRVLELELKRAKRYGYALSVCLLGQVAMSKAAPPDVARALRVRAAAAIAHTVRDIDLPTEIGEDRFLVLLPYTDIDGAAQVGRRMVAAVAAHEPITSAGRAWRTRVVAGIAGLRAGQPVSFARLMKDASTGLRDARERGLDLVVAT
jgi:diguanylate cyclase (GGDEF)-like protein